mmetsp:Transcript_14159/g.18928  ORF Transcript_14159/g.18928 Transcript_14159/m.18928 type:complete len:80 (+) Transcript_14159:246-485(+)
MIGSIFEMGVAPPGAGRGHHRGPPRGPVKGDQSQFFGREGEHRPPMHLPLPTVVIAVAVGILLLILKVYLKPTNKRRSS